MKLEEAMNKFEEIAKECGIDINDLYKTMAKKQEIFNFEDNDKAKEAKIEVMKVVKDAKKSILFNADGHTIVYGSPVTLLSSLCCIIQNLKESIPEELITEAVNIVLEGDK